MPRPTWTDEAEGNIGECGHRFSFGPRNIHSGADPFGPAVHQTLEGYGLFAEFAAPRLWEPH